MAKRKVAPEIIVAENEDRSKAIVKAGRHYAMFEHKRSTRGKPIGTPLDRAQRHADLLTRSFRGRRVSSRAAGRPTAAWDGSGQAIEYARWLAARSRVALPTDDGKPVWMWFTSAHGERRQEKRCCAVLFDSVTITIPNWDFDPAPVCVTSEYSDAA